MSGFWAKPSIPKPNELNGVRYAKTWTCLRTDDPTQSRLTKQQILNENGEEIAEIEFKYMESSPLFLTVS